MGQITKVVIADANEDFRTRMSELLSDEGDFEIIGSTGDGAKAAELVTEGLPDIVLTDLILSGADGFTLLEKVSELPEKLRPKVVVVSGFLNKHIVAAAQACGAAFYMQKPCDPASLLVRMRMLTHDCASAEDADEYRNSQVLEECSGTERLAAEIMDEMGIPTHLKGYQYLREAIMRTVENADGVHAATKELYPEVAKSFNTTASRVERAIQHAIEISWGRGKLAVLRKNLGYTLSFINDKPTNSEFFAMIAGRLRRGKDALHLGEV